MCIRDSLRAILGRLGELLDRLTPTWGPFGVLQGRLGGRLRRRRGLLGCLGLFWGRLGGLLGRSGAILGVSWAILGRSLGALLGRRKAEKKQMPKSFNNLPKSDFGLFGPFWRPSGRPPGPSWAILEPSWAVLMGSGPV
eukprot:7163093-Pyramimonas_sp.AAC.1